MQIKYNSDKKIYTESHLFPYIGNKRNLLPIIQKAMETIPLSPEKDQLRFYDPFAGTGVVSRFAKTLGFQVISSDLEFYSYVTNKAHIQVDATEVESLFAPIGGLYSTLDKLNAYPLLPEDKLYIAKYYCPKDTLAPDITKERLFYTYENGKKIDTLRYAIEELVQQCSISSRDKIKSILLAALIYESANHANTSGVFKGFHQGFGGLGRHCLNRILKPIYLKPIHFYPSKYPCSVFWDDANKLTALFKSKYRFDISYLDPPYNQHQYGSNYHLLNTIALNDKPEIGHIMTIKDNKTRNRAGIRPDWKKTYSNYCSKKYALDDFKNLIKSLNSRYILISYSIDGIIPLDTMLDILSEKGKIDMITSEYVKYRGGRQSLKNDNYNFEFIIKVCTEQKKSNADIQNANTLLTHEFIALYLKKTMDPNKLLQLGFSKKRSQDPSQMIYIKTYGIYQIHINIIPTDISPHSKANKQCRQKLTYIELLGSNKRILPWETLPIDIKDQLKCDLELITNITKDREIEIISFFIQKNLLFLSKCNLDNFKLGNRLSTISNLKTMPPPIHESIYHIVLLYRRYPNLIKKIHYKKNYLICLSSIKTILISTKKIEQLDILKQFLPIIRIQQNLFKLIQSKLSIDKQILKSYYPNVTYIKKKQRQLQNECKNYAK